MLKLVKRLFPFFMSNKPPDIYSLLPRANDDTNIFFWSTTILGKHIDFANTCVLVRLDHCKANRTPKHEFLKAYLILHLDGKKYKVHLIIHRTPAPNVDVDGNPPKPQRSSTASLASLQSTMSSRSRSRSPSSSTFSEHFLGMLGKGDPVPATDHVIIVKAGQEKEFDDACTKVFGSYITLNMLSIDKEHTPMSSTILQSAEKERQRDPKEARRLAEERAAMLESHAEEERKKAGEARLREEAAKKNEEAAKREAGEERRRADEAKKDEEAAKKNEEAA